MYAISDIPEKNGRWYTYYRIPNESGVWTAFGAGYGGGWSAKMVEQNSGMEAADTEAPSYEGAEETLWTNGSIEWPVKTGGSWTGAISWAEYGNTRIQALTGSGAGPTTAFPFLMNSGSTFSPNVPVPPGGHVGPERYLAVTVSADWVEETFSARPLSIASLGTVVAVDLSSAQAVASAKQPCEVDHLLVSALGRRHLHARLASAQHSLKKCEAKHP